MNSFDENEINETMAREFDQWEKDRDLIRQLIEHHRPVVVDDPFGIGALKRAQCKVCDRNEWHLIEPDEEYACEMWKENSYRLDSNEQHE